MEKEKAQLRKDLENLHNKDKELLQLRLKEVERQLTDVEQSHKKRIVFLESTVKELRSFAGSVDDKLLAEAEAALKQGNTTKADLLFKQIEEQEKYSIARAAKAAFERGRIAEDNIDYRNAFRHFERAVGLSPDNPKYLEYAGSMAQAVAKYRKAVEWQEKALSLYLKKNGESFADVARLRNNLGSAWQSLGQHTKAIEYYELALATFKRTLGDNHTNTKVVEANLRRAKEANANGRNPSLSVAQ